MTKKLTITLINSLNSVTGMLEAACCMDLSASVNDWELIEK